MGLSAEIVLCLIYCLLFSWVSLCSMIFSYPVGTSSMQSGVPHFAGYLAANLLRIQKDDYRGWHVRVEVVQTMLSRGEYKVLLNVGTSFGKGMGFISSEEKVENMSAFPLLETSSNLFFSLEHIGYITLFFLPFHLFFFLPMKFHSAPSVPCLIHSCFPLEYMVLGVGWGAFLYSSSCGGHLISVHLRMDFSLQIIES